MGAVPPPPTGLGGGGSGGTKVSPMLANFNGGEFSPALEGRIDIQKYNAGCYRCQNFIPMVQGPARRRSGTRYIAPIKDQDDRSWLTPFRFNVTQSYILEWGDYYLRFYTNRGQVLGPNSLPWNPATGGSGTTLDGATLVWTNRGYPRWASNTVQAQYSVILDPNGQIQVAIAGGTTDGNTPAFTTPGAINPDGTTVVVGVQIIDGSVTWECIGVPQWAPGTAYTLAASSVLTAFVYSITGIQQVTTAGTSSAGTVPTPYEVPTPYSIASLTDAQGFFQLDYDQSNDTIYFCHESETYPPYKLQRLGGTNWRFVLPIFQGGPFQAANPNDTIDVYASAVNGNGITLTASSAIFPPAVIGSQFFMEQDDIRNIGEWEPGVGIVKGDFRRYLFVTYKAIKVGSSNLSGSVPPTHTQGSAWDGGMTHVLWEYQDPGYGSVQITAVGTQTPAGSSIAITGITAATPPVVSAPGHTFINGDVVFLSTVVGMTDVNNNFYVAAGVVAGVSFVLHDSTGAAIVGVAYAAYISGGTASSKLWTATANVISQLPQSVVNSDNATAFWAFGAWSASNGYPKCVKFFRDRLVFARDGFLDLSASADYEDFNAKDASGNVTAAQAISDIIPSREPVQWLVAAEALAIGTAGAELAFGAIDEAQPLGPANAAVKTQLTWGSRRIQAIQIGVDIYYVQTAGRKVRAFEFSFVQNQYTSSDVTVLADHIGLNSTPVSSPGATNFLAMAYAQEPDSVLWCLRADGVVCGYSINKEQDVTGWHRQVIGGGNVESIATIRSPDGTVDDLWMIVNRTINGQITRYVEYLTPAFDYNTPLNQAWFVDAGAQYSGAPATHFTAAHLPNTQIDVLADGNDAGQFTTDASGNFTLPVAASVVTAGLNIQALLAKMRLEAGSPFGAQYATQQGQTKRITNITIRLLNTLGGYFGSWDNYALNGKKTLDPIQYSGGAGPSDFTIPIFTGDTGDSATAFPQGYEREARIMVLADRPLPMTVVGLMPQFEAQARD